MTTITVTKDDDGKLRGVGEKDNRAYARFKKMLADLEIGECVEFSYWFPRSGPFHRRHFKILTAFFDAQEQFADPEQFRMWAQTGAGCCDFVPGPTGKMVALPRSISFRKMDDEAFRQHHEAVVAFLRSLHASRFLWPMLDDQRAGELVESILQEFERESG